VRGLRIVAYTNAENAPLVTAKGVYKGAQDDTPDGGPERARARSVPKGSEGRIKADVRDPQKTNQTLDWRLHQGVF